MIQPIGIEHDDFIMVDPVNACALSGSFETCLSSKDIIPLIHGTSGCPCVLWLMMVSTPDYMGLSELKFPCTNLKENDIIYGAKEKLEQTLPEVIKAYKPKMIMVILSCSAAIIGEDIEPLAKKMTEKYKIPIVAVSRASRWDHTEGRVNALITLVKNVMEDKGVRKDKAVNILGLYCGDYNWRGDSTELKRILEGVGIEVNSVIPAGASYEDIKKASEASINVVISSEYGLKAAQEMEKLFHIPYLYLPPPYGLSGTETWLRAISEELGINKRKVDEFIRVESKRAADLIVPHFTSFGQVRLLRGIPTALFGDASRLAGLINFIVRELGMKPVLVGFKASTDHSFHLMERVKEDLEIEFYLIKEVKSVADILTKLDEIKADFIFGNDIDYKLGARVLKTNAYVGLFNPIFFKYNVTSKPYMGFRGTVYLFEEILNARMMMYQSSRPYGSFWDLPK